jgi:hypothetical protein
MEYSINDILNYCDIDKENLRHDAYQHWYRFLEICIKYNGWLWNTVWVRMRGAVGIDFRYLTAIKETFLSYGVIEINANILHFIGIPDKPKKSLEDNPEAQPYLEAKKKLKEEKEKLKG